MHARMVAVRWCYWHTGTIQDLKTQVAVLTEELATLRASVTTSVTLEAKVKSILDCAQQGRLAVSEVSRDLQRYCDCKASPCASLSTRP